MKNLEAQLIEEAKRLFPYAENELIAVDEYAKHTHENLLKLYDAKNYNKKLMQKYERLKIKYARLTELRKVLQRQEFEMAW